MTGVVINRFLRIPKAKQLIFFDFLVLACKTINISYFSQSKSVPHLASAAK